METDEAAGRGTQVKYGCDTESCIIYALLCNQSFFLLTWMPSRQASCFATAFRPPAIARGRHFVWSLKRILIGEDTFYLDIFPSLRDRAFLATFRASWRLNPPLSLPFVVILDLMLPLPAICKRETGRVGCCWGDYVRLWEFLYFLQVRLIFESLEFWNSKCFFSALYAYLLS